MKMDKANSKKNEIGSIFEIDPAKLQPVKLLQEASAYSCALPDKNVQNSEIGAGLAEILKFAGKKHYTMLTSSGREAILLCLQAIQKERPDLPRRCLMPAYMCDAVFLPFLSEGWELIFYSVGTDLTPEETELNGLIKGKAPGLLFYAPYYGRDTWKELRPFLCSLKGQGILTMEDVTQSYYLQGAGADADFCIGSLRKWYAIPDGGFALSSLPLSDPLMADSDRTERRLAVLTEKWNYLYSPGTPEEQKNQKDRQLQKERYLNGSRVLEEEMDQLSDVSKISAESLGLLKQINEEESCRRRKINYRLLKEGLTGMKSLHHPFLSSDNEGAPLYFPVYAKNRESLQRCLREEGIYAPVLWPVGEANRPFLKESDEALFHHLLALPMDQRYSPEDMQRIIAVILRYEVLMSKG